MRVVISVVIDTEADTPEVWCNGRQVWPRSNWFASAPCRGLPAAIFVPDVQKPSERRAQLANPPHAVTLLCSNCPLRRNCFSLGRLTESTGWWGGALLHDGKPVYPSGHLRPHADEPERVPWNGRNRETSGSKVTWDDVHEIRRRYAAGGITQEALGAEYGLRFNTISNIVTFKSWTKPPKLTAADAETIRRAVAAGVTRQALAAEYGVSRWMIADVVGEASKRQPKLTVADEAEIRRRYATGRVLYRQLAREYGVNKTTIGHIIRGDRDKQGQRKLRH